MSRSLICLAKSGTNREPRYLCEVDEEADGVWYEYEEVDPCLVSCADEGSVPDIEVEYR